MLRRFFVLFFALALVATPALAADDAAPDTTAQAAPAKTLFEAGKIAEARDAYAAAAKANPDDLDAARQAMILSRVLEFEAAVAADDPSPEWEQMACILHAFYLRSDLPEKALAHDRAVYARHDASTTAGLVLETLLEMNRNDEALAFAQDLREGQMDDGNRLYRGIALARLGQTEAVKEDLELFGTPTATDAGLHYDLARLQALMGDGEEALASLQKAFETCPPKGTATLKTLALATPDFRTLRAGEAFQKVLATPSKATGGDCGDCGGCGEGEKGDCGDCDGAEKEDCGGGCPASEKKAEKKGACSGCQGG